METDLFDGCIEAAIRDQHKATVCRFFLVVCL